MGKLVWKEQNGFTLGKEIVDNIILASEVIHSIND